MIGFEVKETKGIDKLTNWRVTWVGNTMKKWNATKGYVTADVTLTEYILFLYGDVCLKKKTYLQTQLIGM